jgi:hypothetical protein
MINSGHLCPDQRSLSISLDDIPVVPPDKSTVSAWCGR